MKLKTKLVLLVFFILAVSMGACAAFSIARLKEYSLSVQVESEREKLRIAGRAFRQVGTREDFGNMGEIAREGTKILLRRLEDGVIDNRRIYLENKLIIRETVKNLNI